jgi:prophage regulatory protein
MTNTEAQRFLRRRDVQSLTGLSCSTIYARVKEGSFPAPFPIGPQAVAWLEADVVAWQRRVMAAAGKAA